MKTPFTIKIGDILVYIFIFLLIGGSFFGLYLMGENTNDVNVVVELDGEQIGIYKLPKDDSTKEIRINTGDGGYNILVLVKDGAYIQEANCADKICVRWGKISRPGQTIVCLPHRLKVSIIGQSNNEEPLDDISS